MGGLRLAITPPLWATALVMTRGYSPKQYILASALHMNVCYNGEHIVCFLLLARLFGSRFRSCALVFMIFWGC